MCIDVSEGNRLVMSGVGDCRVVLLEGEGQARCLESRLFLS